ncbi:hypothetical protein GALMADRAFT_81152 [Galerina marginata CBS 339.88]|uniref:G domain-containing protein n=1 Tax=Galerina marginata (strain CBS 339.88) TaxID=685588 RepID=A0A067SHF0_GALM3|nr:hypothetical protein GALMADRAFT_81152 [Galerina marginata CBS 339.88]
MYKLTSSNLSHRIMGATGTGKTSFIRLITEDDNIIISDSLESQTSDLCRYPYDHPSGRKVTFIDTPGFDDSRDDTTDVDVLSKISLFLDEEYKSKRCLNGVIYLHNIANTRMGGISRRNLKMFQKLVGNDSLCNVIIVTTMWSTVDNAVGEKREEELRSKDVFFKPLLEQKAQLLRHDSGKDSADRIVNAILENDPRALLIQTELSEPGCRLVDTSAGVEIVEEFERLDERDKKKLEALGKELEQALKDGDSAVIAELVEKRDKLVDNIDGRKQDRKALERDADELDLFYGIRAGYRASGISGAIVGGIAATVGSLFLSQAKETEERAGVSKEHSVAKQVAEYAVGTEELVGEMAEAGREFAGSTGAFFGGLLGAIIGTTGSILDGSSHVDQHIGHKD